MTGLDTRILAYTVWGLGTLLVYSIVLIDRRRRWKAHHDRRSGRDLMEAISFWLVAAAAFVAITAALWGPGAPSTFRGLASAVALGAFTMAGALMAFERHPDETR